MSCARCGQRQHAVGPHLTVFIAILFPSVMCLGVGGGVGVIRRLRFGLQQHALRCVGDDTHGDLRDSSFVPITINATGAEEGGSGPLLQRFAAVVMRCLIQRVMDKVAEFAIRGSLAFCRDFFHYFPLGRGRVVWSDHGHFHGFTSVSCVGVDIVIGKRFIRLR